MGLPKPQQRNSADQNVEQDKPQFMMHRTCFEPIPGLFSCAVISTCDKYFLKHINKFSGNYIIPKRKIVKSDNHKTVSPIALCIIFNEDV